MRMLAAVSVLWLLGCDPSPGQVRPWQPSDHDEPGSAPAPQVGAQTAMPGDDDPNLVSLAWRRNCLSCHGPQGRGDGPQGPMVKAPDLTRKDWLASAKDADIEKVIRQGRNKMPAFGHLPDRVIEGLVKRVRAGGSAH